MAPRSPQIALFLGLVLACAAAAPVWAVDIYPLDELQPGQRGEGYSVFFGDSISRFEVEIVDRVPGQAPYPLVLVRCLGEEFERSGVSQGMSGSPVYLDGRLLGAIAFNFSFAREPLALLTPAAAMLALAERPVVGATDAPGDRGELPFLAPDWQAAEQPVLGRGEPLALSVGGVAPARLAELGAIYAGAGLRLLPMGRAAETGGGGDAATDTALAPGAAVAVELLRGPIAAAAIGTVTHREGSRIWAFGHPFLGEGPSALPLASARIHGVMPSLMSSFKLGSVGRSLGTLLQDGQAGIYGELGPVPALLPLRVILESAGEPPRVALFEVARHRRLLPALVRMALDGWLPGRLGAAQAGSLELSLRIHATAAAEPTVLVERFAGPGSVVAPAAWLQSLLQVLQENPAGPLPLDSLVIALRWREGERPTHLDDLSLAAAALRPGETWRLRLRVRVGEGEPELRELAFPTVAAAGVEGLAAGARLPVGRYVLHVADGASFDRWNAVRRPALYRFDDHAGLLDLLARLESSRRWIVWLEAPGTSAVVGGREFDLPVRFRELAPPAVLDEAAEPKKSRRLVALRREAPGEETLRGHLALPVTVLEHPRRSSTARSQP